MKQPERPRVRMPALALRALVLGLAYGAVNLLVSFVTSFGTDVGAAFWPGAGLTVAALLIRPRREWPVLLAAVFAAEVAADLITGFGLARALAFAVANCSESFLGATLVLGRRDVRPDFARVTDLQRFVAGGVLAGPALGALLGTALPALLVGDHWLPRLPRWFIGDAVGVAVVSPVLLTWGGRLAEHRRGRVWPAAALAFTAVVTVGPWSLPGRYGGQYLLIPALVLVALRLPLAAAASSLFLVGILVETVTAVGSGPFVDYGPSGGLLAAQMFLAMSAFTALTVAGLTTTLVERGRSEAVLRLQAFHDSLTGLANRRLFQDRLEHAVARLVRQPGLIGVICLDLDGFKAINDRHGHAAGDAVLVEVGRRIQRAVRDVDTVARLGGDEFLVLIEDVAQGGEAEALAARLSAELDKPVVWEGAVLAVGVSVGLALTAEPGTDPAWLIAEADRAMYRAKPGRELVLPADDGAVNAGIREGRRSDR